MKKIFLGLLLMVSAVPALWAQETYTAQANETGSATVFRNYEPYASVGPQIAMEGWKILPFRVAEKGSKFDAIDDLPDGAQVGLNSSVTISGNTLHVHYRLTPLKDVRVICVRAAVYLSYKDWVQAPYRLGASNGKIPAEVIKTYFIAGSDAGSGSLGPSNPEGLSVQMKDSGLYTSLEDDRNWGTYLGWMVTHNEPYTPWVWKAGEVKDFDFTLTFKSEFSIPPGSPNRSKDPAGFWYGRIETTEQQDRTDRYTLQIEKRNKWKYIIYGHNLDAYGGGENQLAQKAVWNGKILHLELREGTADLTLNASGDSLKGTGKYEGKEHALDFKRGLNYVLPRVDTEGTAVTEYSYRLPQTLADGWSVEDLRKSPLDPKIVVEGVDKILSRRVPNIESLVVVQNGRMVMEEYFKGLGPEDSHQLQSATKSVLSILFGIAQDQGLVNVKDRLFDYFPEYRKKPGWEPPKDKITLESLLTMTSGFACDDFTPATNCQEGMWKSDDWLDFTLSIHLNHEPGEHWAYCNDCMEVLGAVIARKSGMAIPDFAQKNLFDPLGIQEHQWVTGPNQVTEVCGSLWMKPRDMAKLGQLYLQKGVWNGKQVVSEKWVGDSTKPQAPFLKDYSLPIDYGYLWWEEQMPYKGRKIRVFNAAGLGNQYIFVVPELNLVCAMTAGNYKDSNVDGNPVLDFFKSYILGAFK